MDNRMVCRTQEELFEQLAKLTDVGKFQATTPPTQAFASPLALWPGFDLVFMRVSF
jgi:hypothetical protein